MRKAVLALASLLPLPARAHDTGEHPVTFEALPCAATCAHWLPDRLGYRACENPFPPGSYADVITEPAPDPPAGKKIILRFELSVSVDWDAFFCSYPGYGELSSGCGCIFPPPCDGPLGDLVPVGCSEQLSVPAEAARRYVLRAYNVSDPFPAAGSYRWIFV